MGCKASKPAIAIEMEAAKDEQGKEENRDDLLTAPTPYDIRKIRNELFSRDSIVAVIPSNETASTQEDSLSGFSARSSDGIVFMQPNGEPPKRPRQQQQHQQKMKQQHQQKMSYHYPAALYQKKIKKVHHFVPPSDHQQEFPKLRRAASAESDEYSCSYMSDLGGEDIRFQGSMNPFEALVDTMALSLEPPSDESEFMMRHQHSFGALVDQLSEAEEEEDYAVNSDGEDTANMESGKSTSCTAMAYRKPKKNGKMNKRAAGHRLSAPPAISPLEQQMSYEIAADIKSMAFMTDMSDRSAVLSGQVQGEATQFHRNDSIVPVRKDNISVCSGW